MKNMRKNAEAAETISDERKIVDSLKNLRPGEIVQRIERGWQNGTFPASEPIVKEYLKSAAALKKLDSLDVTSLLSLIRQNGNGVGNAAGESGTIMTPESMFAAMQANQRTTAGASPKEPFYVKSK